jgi:protein-disulfide isomerase
MDDGDVLITAAPTPSGRDYGAEGLCRGIGGHAQSVDGPVVVEPTTRTERPCDGMAAITSSAERLQVTLGDAYVRGPADAAVTIVEFSDYQCPYCSRVQATLNRVLETYPEQVRLVFFHNPLPFHANAPLAHQAALAAGEQGQFWEMHDVLFENQRALSRSQIEGYARGLGIDMTAFNLYLDAASGQAVVDADQVVAARVGARGTPNFFINGRSLRGAQPFERFAEVIDEELAFAATAAAGGTDSGSLYDCWMELASLGTEDTTPTGRTEPDDITVVDPPEVGSAPFVGPEDAAVTIIEFSDFQCPFCNRVNSTLEEIVRDYPTNVRVVFMQFPLAFHGDAHLAAQASLAAHEQGRFWEMHDLLFENQRALSRAHLERYAAAVGLDLVQFNNALDSRRFATQVDEDVQRGRDAGVTGTPTFLINGERLVGAQSASAFREAIDRQLEAVAAD